MWWESHSNLHTYEDEGKMKMRRPARLALHAAATLGLSGTPFLAGTPGLAAQAPQVQRLAAPELTYETDFTALRSLRPLSDGSVLAVEGQLQQVLRLPADGGAASEVGTRGQGPGEYMDPGAVLPLGPSDFSLLVDWTQQRLLILDPTGRTLASEPWVFPVAVVPAARDAMERMYWDNASEVRMGADGEVVEGDATLFRIVPGSEPQPVTALAVRNRGERWASNPVSRMFNPGQGGVARMPLARSPFGHQDIWTLAPDGRIVVARLSPFRLEFIAPDGTVTRGPELPYDPIRVTGRDRTGWIENAQRGQENAPLTFNVEGAGPQRIQRPGMDPDQLFFPETKPPFPWNGLHTAGPGRVVLQRHVAAEADHTRVDLFDGTGRLLRTLQLPPDRTLVGAAEGVLFTLRYNEFDVQILERWRFEG